MKAHKTWVSRTSEFESKLWNSHPIGEQPNQEAFRCSTTYLANRKHKTDQSSNVANGGSNLDRSIHTDHPWLSPRTVYEQSEFQSYQQLKDRLAQIPSRSKQKRQSLYVDLWTGQHWLCLTLTDPKQHGILKPVSVDTAISIATIGSFRLVNQPLYAPRA